MKHIKKSLFFILLFILIFSNSSQAASPVSAISASVSPYVIEAGDSGVLTVTISETGGRDWIKNPTVSISSIPPGINFIETEKDYRGGTF